MPKVRNFAELAPNIGFSEFDFYDLYRSTFEKSELGRMKKLLPLHAMAENFGLVSKSLRPKLGRRSYFAPEGKVALMFLKIQQLQGILAKQLKQRKWEETPVMPEPKTGTTARRMGYRHHS